MSYQALARKWRPQQFETLIGQAQVLRALTNSLDKQQLHHAYLFTGTRGIGKTSVARIIAKALNCQQGISAHPCGQCTHCLAIDQGRFVDLLEIDAASRTRVEDTRELLDNIPYAPQQGRFKIYLIDEVHMLSTHSFNALLKTLEEPPEHVKFLLATTDPQKLPITVLSRCLQFHLKALTPEQIAQQLKTIAEAENFTFEFAALELLSQAADGSMRDALSLFEQAASYANGNLTTKDIRELLGLVEKQSIEQLLQALIAGDGVEIMQIIDQLALDVVDFQQALEALIHLLHEISLAQYLQPAKQNFSTSISAEDLQLFYQIAITGRRDLPLAPTARIGFEMTLLRMLAFKPAAPAKAATQKPPATVKPTLKHIEPNQPTPSSIDWPSVVKAMQLSGMASVLANNCSVKTFNGTALELAVTVTHATLVSQQILGVLNTAINQYFSKPIKISIQPTEAALTTPSSLAEQKKASQQHEAERLIEKNATIKMVEAEFNAAILPESIKLQSKED